MLGSGLGVWNGDWVDLACAYSVARFATDKGSMFQTLVEIQRTIYTALAEQIKLLSAEGDWLAFLAFLPMGIFFGAVTP